MPKQLTSPNQPQKITKTSGFHSKKSDFLTVYKKTHKNGQKRILKRDRLIGKFKFAKGENGAWDIYCFLSSMQRSIYIGDYAIATLFLDYGVDLDDYYFDPKDYGLKVFDFQPTQFHLGTTIAIPTANTIDNLYQSGWNFELIRKVIIKKKWKEIFDFEMNQKKV